MIDKPDIVTAAEKAAETFNLNLKRSCEAISLARPKIDEGPKIESLKIAGMDIDYLLHSEPHIGEFADYSRVLYERIITEKEARIRASCYELNIDPDALVNQAKLISDLRKALDACGNQIIGAPFTEYMKVLEENARLKNIIRMLLGGHDYNEQFA